MGKFKSGDVLALKSGGPDMTFMSYNKTTKADPDQSGAGMFPKTIEVETEYCRCKYWDEKTKKFETEEFHEDMLEIEEED